MRAMRDENLSQRPRMISMYKIGSICDEAGRWSRESREASLGSIQVVPGCILVSPIS